MSRSSLTLKALGDRIAAPSRALQNRIRASRSRLGTRPEPAETLPEPVLFGDADLGAAMVAGRWTTLGHEVALGEDTIWAARLPDPRLEAERQGFLWLDDLGALGNRAARERAQAWVLDWIARYGAGGGPGWAPALAGRRAKRWTAHARMLTADLDAAQADRFWRGLASQQRYLDACWDRAAPGLDTLRALAGLVWSGVALPHAGHEAAKADLAAEAEAVIDPTGGLASRSPEELAEAVMLLIWTARVLENAGQQAPHGHLAAIVRAVPVLRQLRLGGGTLGCFHGGGPGDPGGIDQALAELRIGVQDKPKLPMGYARLGGGRVALLLDGALPPEGDAAVQAHASTLAFEMSVHREPLVISAGPGRVFGGDWTDLSRQTAAHSALEIDGRSSARIESHGLAARTFGARLEPGPTRVSIRQAQDASGQWLLATQDGYVASHGVLHERRIFVEARGAEVRGEDILSVPDARAQAQHDRASRDGPLDFAVRFHLPPGIGAEHDAVRQVVMLTLPSGEVWMFRAAGGEIGLEESVVFDPRAAAPMPSRQVVVRADLVEYLGQVIWSFGRAAEAPAPAPAEVS